MTISFKNHPLQYRKIISVFSKFSFFGYWLQVLLNIWWIKNYNFQCTFRNILAQKIVSRRLPITALPPSWYKIKFQPKPPKKYWPKMGVGRVLKLVIIVSLCIIAMFICTFENILFKIGRLTNMESFFPTFSHLIALYIMKFWRQNSKI